MAAEITENVYLTDDNTFDIGFTVNGQQRTEGISRITAFLYDKVALTDPPIVLDSDVDGDQEYFNYNDITRIIFSFGHVPALQDKEGKSYYLEVRLYDNDGKRIRVSSVKSDSDLPTINLKVHKIV